MFQIGLQFEQVRQEVYREEFGKQFKEGEGEGEELRALCPHCFARNIQMKKQWLAELGDSLAEAHSQWASVSLQKKRDFQRSMEEHLDLISGTFFT